MQCFVIAKLILDNLIANYLLESFLPLGLTIIYLIFFIGFFFSTVTNNTLQLFCNELLVLCLFTRLDDSGRFSHLRRTASPLYGRDLPRAPDAELLQWLL